MPRVMPTGCRALPFLLLLLLSAGRSPGQEATSDFPGYGVFQGQNFQQPAESPGFLFSRVESRSMITVLYAYPTTSEFDNPWPVRFVLRPGTPEAVVVPRGGEVACDRSLGFRILSSMVEKLPPTNSVDADEAGLVETQPVRILGSPRRKASETTDAARAPSPIGASIASLERDEYGRLIRIRLDGEVDPGYSGGPVLDAKGALIGMAVVPGMDSRGAWCVPISVLRQASGEGWVEAPQVEPKNYSTPGKIQLTLSASARVSRLLKKFEILYGPVDRRRKEPKPDEPLIDGAKGPPSPGLDARAELEVPAEELGRTYVAQAHLELASGKHLYSGATTFVLAPDDLRGDAPAPSGEDPRYSGPASACRWTSTCSIGDAYAVELLRGPELRVRWVAWDPSEEHVYTLDPAGRLWKIKVPEGRVEIREALGFRPGWMGLTSEGLAVVTANGQELILIHTGTLKPAKRISSMGGSAFASSPRSPWVVGIGTSMVVVDAKAQKVVRKTPLKAIVDEGGRAAQEARVSELATCSRAVMTADGGTLVASAGGRLHRLANRNGKISWEQSTPDLAGPGNRGPIPLLGRDESRVAAFSESLREKIPGFPDVAKPTAYYFKIRDFERCDGAATCTSLYGFDSSTSTALAWSKADGLCQADLAGKPRKVYPGWPRGSWATVIPSPSGRRLLFLNQSSICWIGFP